MPREYDRWRNGVVGGVDFDDLIRATSWAAGATRHGRMGALQARSGDRASADRRGAGHQSGAMDDHPRRWSDEFFVGRRARTPDRVRGLCSPSATTNRRSSAFRGPTRNPLRRLPKSIFAGEQPRTAAAADDDDAATAPASADCEFVAQPVADAVVPLHATGARIRRCYDRGDFGEPGLGVVADREVHASEVPGPGTVTLWPPVVVGRAARMMPRKAGCPMPPARWRRRIARTGEAVDRRRSDAGKQGSRTLQTRGCDDPRQASRRTCLADRRAALCRGRAGRGGRSACG